MYLQEVLPLAIVYSIVRDTLGLPHPEQDTRHIRTNVAKNVVLDAEMVAFSDRFDRIDGML